ncbi:hypothetical protein BCR42DRAFT_417925 [Absidia repens]|uniref:Transcription regulator Rua1 C-terminal domain-containing protein n=1 Tax=Absidia repens TaxID=90262 RepID=A0A1X2ICL4_9FUNG|nr:hypothetical protein BCR42DRAFT_417925 [Absidia repens]
MDIQDIPPPTPPPPSHSTNQQRSVHYADTPTTFHYTPTPFPPSSTSTQPQAHHNSITSSSLAAEPTLATIHEYGSPSTNNSFADDTDYLPTTTITLPDDSCLEANSLLPSDMNPALLLGGRFDKRKSSPAILGLPFGITDDPQLDLHLSQHRNSIEAAMLLANFNRIPTTTIANESPKDSIKVAPQQQWQDDLSIAAQTQDKVMDQDLVSLRRHSYDVGMNWKSMPQEFRERTDLFNNSNNNNDNDNDNLGSAFKPVLKQEQGQSHYSSAGIEKSRITWTQDGLYQASTTANSSGSSTPIVSQPPTLLHPHMFAADQRHPADTYPRQQEQDPSFLHPLARHHPSSSSDSNEQPAGQKREEHYSYSSRYGDQQQQQQHPHHLYPPHLQKQQQQQQQPYYYPNTQQQQQQHHHQQHLPPHTPHPSLGGKLPLPNNGNMIQGMYPPGPHGHSGAPPHMYHPHPHPLQGHPPPPPPPSHGHLHPSQFSPSDYAAYQQAAAAAAANGTNMMLPPPPQQQQQQLAARPKRKRAPKETEEVVEIGDADFPDMCPRDVELAKTDLEARPRRQKLRFEGDMYTPKWVRYNSQSKEGLCDTCRPGRWLQLKNSAYWYHKQFYHGISSVSGTEFAKPMETRWVDQDLVEGLCHQCHQWVAVSNVKRKNSVLWFRHAHKCHVYHKPKNAPRRP